MPNVQLKKTLGEGFVGVTGTAPRSGAVTVNSITPRVHVYVKTSLSNIDEKIYSTRPLPITYTFQAGEQFECKAMEDCTLNYTINFD